MAIPRSPSLFFFSACNRQPCARDGAGMAAEFCNHTIARSDADVVDAGPSVARDLARGRSQNVTQFAGPDESDVALCRDGALVVRVAGKGKRRVREQEDEAAMRNPLAVDHVR